MAPITRMNQLTPCLILLLKGKGGGGGGGGQRWLFGGAVEKGSYFSPAGLAEFKQNACAHARET